MKKSLKLGKTSADRFHIIKTKRTDTSYRNAQMSLGIRQARSQDNVTSPSDSLPDLSFDETADPEEVKQQRRAQQKVYSKRITKLRDIVTENHSKIINGHDPTQYDIPAENLSMEAHYGERYMRLADAYHGQVLLKSRLSALDNVNAKQAIIDEMKKWDVKNDELYVKKLTSCHQQIDERAKHQSVQRPIVRNPFGIAPENTPESLFAAQRTSHPGPMFNLPSFQRSSDDLNTSRAGYSPTRSYPQSPMNVVTTAVDQTKNADPSARLPSTVPRDRTIHALGGAASVNSLPKMKRIIIRLLLPEDDKRISRKMFWSQPLSRDDFFQQVSERFRDYSVQCVETTLDGDGILVEPTGSEDEWEILQEELCRILGQSSTEKLSIDVVVHVG